MTAVHAKTLSSSYFMISLETFSASCYLVALIESRRCVLRSLASCLWFTPVHTLSKNRLCIDTSTHILRCAYALAPDRIPVNEWPLEARSEGWKRHLWSCTPAQSVVQRALVVQASVTTCFNSACWYRSLVLGILRSIPCEMTDAGHVVCEMDGAHFNWGGHESEDNGADGHERCPTWYTYWLIHFPRSVMVIVIHKSEFTMTLHSSKVGVVIHVSPPASTQNSRTSYYC